MTLSRRRVPESASVYPQTGRDALCGRRARCSRGRQSIVTDKTTTKVRTKVSGAGARRNLLKAATGAAALGLIPARATAQADPRSMRPQAGDRFVYSSGPRKGAVVATSDLTAGGPHVTAYAQIRKAASCETDRVERSASGAPRPEGSHRHGSRQCAGRFRCVLCDLHACRVQRLGLGCCEEKC